ncbi:hypothetical protein Goshw_011631, partial [Gossypium schwendimanii]|nr:hypothetical protein [Gossypium schwendimanii]
PAEEFLHCLSLRFHNSSSISELVYTQHNSSYSSVLKSSAQNFRLSTPSTPTPLLIITPLHASHIQATVHCCKKHGLQLRIRSGGHDFEGLSYTTTYEVPFVVIDLLNLGSVRINVEKGTAWVESGATVGELYYEIAKRSRTLAVPAGIGHTVGVGGHLSGGGFGLLFRKYGLAADNVIDARLIDVKERILDRKSMGEDLFWAIRGGGGGSFGVVLAWKLKLVAVPAIVTVFTVSKTLEQNATKLIHRWQYIAHKLPKEIHMSIGISRVKSNENEKMTIQASFRAVFLGSIDELLPLMEEKFPQLGIEEVKSAIMVFVAYGGKMDEILETETPFPHRAGKLYSISYVVDWEEEENKNSEKDLDTGTNEINDKENSDEQAKIWGIKYFKSNFDRLVHVKTVIDPENFFRHEQSVPPLPCLLKKGANSNSLGSL